MKLLKNQTNRLAKKFLVLGFTSLVAATTVFGQIAFDEWGNAIGIPHGFVGADPSGGIVGAPVLMYSLPFGVVPGDVLLTDVPGGGVNQYSDVIRFWNPNGSPNQSLIIFYSDLPEFGEVIVPPADVGLPAVTMVNFAGPFLEIGTETFNFYDYTATLFMPGSSVGGPITYHIVSDGLVPEPSAGALAALGGGLLFTLKRRFQNRRK